MKQLDGSIAFITGGASGLGLSMAQSLAARGVRIALADIDEATLAQAADTLRCQGATVHALRLDVADASAWPAAADAVEKALGPVNILCSNAGVVGSRTALGVMPPKAWQWVIDVNLNSMFHAVHTFVPRMQAKGGEGHIVGTASLGGLLPQPRNAAYSAAKAGVISLFEALREELVDTPIGVSVLSPGLVATALHDSTMKLAPEDIRDQCGIEPELQAMMKDAIPAQGVGELVVQGILDHRFWLFTHPELRPYVKARVDGMLEAMQPQ